MSNTSKISYAATILKPRDEVYRAWRVWVDLPLYSRHLKKVEDPGGSRTRWTTEGPAGDLTWEATTTVDIANERIGWRTVGEPDVENAGRIDFKDAPGDRGTEVVIHLVYSTPVGLLGNLVAKITGNSPEAQLAETLRRFKAILECGETPVVEGQPSNQMRHENETAGEPTKARLR